MTANYDPICLGDRLTITMLPSRTQCERVIIERSGHPPVELLVEDAALLWGGLDVLFGWGYAVINGDGTWNVGIRCMASGGE